LDTFSHILIAFLIYAKFDMRMAFIAGFMGMFVDLDILLYPLSLKYQIFEHRGIGHSFIVVIIYTSIISYCFTFFTSLDFGRILLAGLTGSLLHIFCDTMTNYGTYTLYPFVKKHIKLNIIFGVDPITVIINLISLYYLIDYFIKSNIEYFYLVCNILIIFYVLYFVIHITLKIIVHMKFRTITLPTLYRINFKIVKTEIIEKNEYNCKKISWNTYNILLNRSSPEKTFELPLFKVDPPLESLEDMIAYTYNLKNIQRFFNRVDFLICNAKYDENMDGLLFWHSLELEFGKFKMGLNVLIKKDGTYKIFRSVPLLKKNK